MEGRALRALRTGVAELRPPWLYQSYALLAGGSKLLPSLALKRRTGLPPSLEP
jgi:hypothetical protein